MKRPMFRRFLRRPVVTVAVVVAFFARSVTPAYAESPVELKNWSGRINFSTERLSPFSLEGTASHLGQFTAYGEVMFVPVDGQGTLHGNGVVVFQAANGDLLVGAVTWDADPAAGGGRSGGIHFSWRDSVQFSDRTVVSSTGRFADAQHRPPGLVVIAIIAILIGLLLPAVQKVR